MSNQTLSFMSVLTDGIGGNKTCIEHNVFMCNKCLVKEVDLLTERLAAAKLTLAEVGNVLGGPVAAVSEEIRHRERTERIDKAVKLISEALTDQVGPLRERLADLCHRQWSNWMVHMFSKCERHSDRYIIPAWAVKRWKAQMTAPYEKLSEEDQDKDRREADRFIALLRYGIAKVAS